MSKDAVIEIATKDMRSETARCVPVKSLEQALADAEDAQRLARGAFSRGGGRTGKRDVLQRLIIEIVRKNPNP